MVFDFVTYCLSWLHSEIAFATGAPTPVTTASGEDPLLCDFPELNALEISEYVNVDDIPRYDPYEDKVIGDAAQLRGRRRSELKRLETNGWTREEVEAVSSKRWRFVYVGPDAVTGPVTSLKNAMKEISLCAVVDTTEQDALYEAEKCVALM